MLPIEKMENTVRRFNVLVLILGILHIVRNTMSVFVIMWGKSMLDSGQFKDQGLSKAQLDILEKSYSPLAIAVAIIAVVIGIAIVVIAVRNFKSLNDERDVTPLGAYLGIALVIIQLIFSLTITINVWSFILPIVYLVLYGLAAKQMMTFNRERKTVQE